MSIKRPDRLLWLLRILRDAKPALVEPHEADMRRVAHWAWSNGLANRHFSNGKVTYSISELGAEMLAAEREGGSHE